MTTVRVVMSNGLPVACFSQNPSASDLTRLKYDQVLTVDLDPEAPYLSDDEALEQLRQVDAAAALVLRGWLTPDTERFGSPRSRKLSDWLFDRFIWGKAPLGNDYWNAFCLRLKDKGL